ncbi:hypothetical protein JD844_013366 [Phrynosoma platyrhinos]|uniref:Zinc finger protein RFP-like n=1 Tax=Phrynosoma platyrhinos TaxID=52577 RepID=A0ABQ7TLW6_PHRPL|nr:hypothetical protein JD844_013366 [Phrynosoma platyrhinos]
MVRKLLPDCQKETPMVVYTNETKLSVVCALYRKTRPMAALNAEKSLQDEATCPICLDYFQSPMMIIDCGHNFCQGCITQYCEGSSGDTFSCPQCRKPFLWKNLQPNRHLLNIVELAKQFRVRPAKEGEQKLCEKHQEPLKLFCEEDKTSICVVCDRSKVHKTHSVIPVEEAAQFYQNKTKDETQNLVWEFQQLRQVLEKQEQLLLVKLEELEAETEKRKAEQANELSAEISHLDIQISELEQKYQDPPAVMLQDIGSTLNRCKRVRFELPAPLDSSELMKKLQEFTKESESLQKELKKFRETLTEPKWIKEDVMLDPVTAHPRFIVSEDLKSVRWGPVREELPYDAKRFDPSRCVLGSQGFSSGKHHWTVDVDDGHFWAVGAARESVKRKGQFSIVPEEGIWAVGFLNGQYKVLTSPPTILKLSKPVRKIQICLDYEGKTLAFFDVEEKKRFVLFSSLTFKSQKIYPFFRAC